MDNESGYRDLLQSARELLTKLRQSVPASEKCQINEFLAKVYESMQ